MIFWFFSGTTTTYQKDNFWFHESIWKSALFPPKWNWLQQALLAYYSLRNYCLPEKRGPLIGMPEILYCFGAATNQNDRLRKNEMKEVFFLFAKCCQLLYRPQCYRQWLFKAPLCITLKIKIWVVAYFFNFY